MIHRLAIVSRAALAASVLAACHSTPAPIPSSPAASPPTVPSFQRGIAPRPAPPLPAIPVVEGPLAPKVVYPEPNEMIGVRDSNFIFGSVGNGHAQLTINGTPVRVAPNGTFLAYLPVPSPAAPRYELVARTESDSARLVVPVRLPPPPVDLPLTGRLAVDSGSVVPRGVTLGLRDDEPVRVTIRAPTNATVSVSAGGVTQPLVNTGGNTFATDVPARQLRNGGTLSIQRGTETVHFTLSHIASGESEPPHFVLLGDPAAQKDTDAAIVGRSTPSGTYKWLLVPGTVVQETGRSGDNVRVRLDSQLEVWVDSVRELPVGYPSPRRTIGAMAIVPSPEWVDVIMPVSSPPPYLIEQDMNRLTLTLYGTQATPDIIKFLQNDSLVRVLNWVPEQSDRIRISMELSQPPFGYLVLYDSRGFVLRLRRPPRVNATRPLEGLTITVDPGHPPGGAIGPTGYTEAQGVLAVGLKLRDILRQRGARVVMTRTDMNPVDLHLRSVIARRANAHLLVSVHENAFGEGIDPFPNVGTSTLFFHSQSEPLARLVQQSMMNQLGLRDLGIHYQNIAIGRTTWMPSIITEGLFLMVPEQEYAAKDPGYQERYARGVADGIEAYFRGLAK